MTVIDSVIYGPRKVAENEGVCRMPGTLDSAICDNWLALREKRGADGRVGWVTRAINKINVR